MEDNSKAKSLENPPTANITVLTATLLIDEAWGAVTSLASFNCFKKPAFIKEAHDNLEDVAVLGLQADGEIFSVTVANALRGDEDALDTLETLVEVSVKEASASFDILQRCCLQNERDGKAFLKSYGVV
ncbi:unnamed protein product [Ceratitis capitata]|uniref:(Mediterranean fruit fly) hypothetical protein n=1 Tax=Ceratitis capitata TaxID=7213 RepID=A0A811UCS9_CERCA|nr:unnamed protein product [Ceratitis capitata]